MPRYAISATLLMDLIEAAEAAEQRLRNDYQALVGRKRYVASEGESWPEGDALRSALDALRRHMIGQRQ